MTDAELGYSDPRGATVLRSALADYLGRVRGVVADPERVVVTYGYAQGLALVCRALAARGASRIGMEDPSNLDDQAIVTGAGLEPVPIGVDADGLRVDELARLAPDAVIVTPAHQQPTGVVLSRERRLALVDWLRAHGAVAVEDDYDAEYRYDRAAVGALQGLAPEHVIYAGTTSKTLAPALRLGWLVVPAALLEGIAQDKLVGDRGAARIEEYAFADFVTRGELDRHLRRMRARYRRQRDAMVQALARELPEAVGHGHRRRPARDGRVARGLRRGGHPRRGRPSPDRPQLDDRLPRGLGAGSTTLMLGYGSVPEPAIEPGVREIAEVVRAVAQRSRPARPHRPSRDDGGARAAAGRVPWPCMARRGHTRSSPRR